MVRARGRRELTGVRVCSIVTARDVAGARVLVANLAQHAPGTQVTLLHVGDGETEAPEISGAEVVGPEELGIDPLALMRWRLTRDLAGLVGTLRPHFVRHLLGRGEVLLCLDPTRVAVGPLEEPHDVPSGVGLLPRLVEPIPVDELQPSESVLAQQGVVDPGVVLVAPEAGPVLGWWAERVDVDPATPWLDLALAMFPDLVGYVRPPGWNVSQARLLDRPLERRDGVVTLEGDVVSFLDLTGFDPRRPWLVDGRQTRDLRTLVSRDRVLGELLDEHARDLVDAGHDDGLHDQLFSVVDGVVVDDVVQTLVRHEVDALRRRGGTRLDLGRGGTALRDWLTEPDPDVDGVRHLGRYLAELYRRRPDLHQVYPGVRDGDVSGYLDWTELVGIRTDGIPRWVVEAGNRLARPARDAGPVSTAPAPPTLVPGVEVVGFLSADLGIGQAARMLVSGLEKAGLPISSRTYTRTSSRLGVEWTDRPAPAGARHDTVVVCINADMLPTFMREDAGPGFADGRRVIGFWFWELDDFPASMHPAIEPLDEIWVTSSFTADVLRAATDKPVHVLPLPVHSPERSDVVVPELGDSDVFTYLFVFDYLSVFQRKNPLGLVAAYTEAFPAPGEARLVIKSINRAKRPDHAEHLAYAIRDRPDIVVIDRYLSRGELDALMWRADCYVSLHRSEGFGFTMAEEMAIGKPVIATGYSGNMEFMTPANSRPLRHRMVSVPPDAEPYPEGASWAEPRRGHAVTAMRRVLEDAELRARLGREAAATIAERHSVEALARAVLERLAAPAPHQEGRPGWRASWGRAARGRGQRD
ncbi:glycosyltransferase family 4 protein [Nocardioides piscis]|uniref:Glycosyltransferase n=1 Tax=Nocardioides piscis TaxID=2714938 RepID=A0A6G7YH08_9ACTN|nr:glycosyltransferase [Nocardioides piscis]QIK75956.1 glycosyltransferase [Nocardioides piscis]